MSKNRNNLIHSSRLKKSGLPPGTVLHQNNASEQKIDICLFEFNDQFFSEKKDCSLEDISATLHNKNIKWIDIEGISNTKLIEQIVGLYSIHPLTLEDVINTDQRAKFEDYATYTVTITRMVYYDDAICSEQLSIILLDNTVITFQEEHGKDPFDPVRERIRNNKGRVRKAGSDYLAYALLDAVVDNYFHILDRVGSRIEILEEVILDENHNTNIVRELHELKRQMVFLRRALWPIREVIATLQRSQHSLYSPNTLVYIRDVYDHSVRIADTIETYRDLLSGMLDMYLSVQSNKMNEVMKLLTIISSVFIPVTFLVGVYGMNFDFMPELRMKYGYYSVWILMIIIIFGMLYYFKRKKWL